MGDQSVIASKRGLKSSSRSGVTEKLRHELRKKNFEDLIELNIHLQELVASSIRSQAEMLKYKQKCKELKNQILDLERSIAEQVEASKIKSCKNQIDNFLGNSTLPPAISPEVSAKTIELPEAKKSVVLDKTQIRSHNFPGQAPNLVLKEPKISEIGSSSELWKGVVIDSTVQPKLPENSAIPNRGFPKAKKPYKVQLFWQRTNSDFPDTSLLKNGIDVVQYTQVLKLSETNLQSQLNGEFSKNVKTIFSKIYESEKERSYPILKDSRLWAWFTRIRKTSQPSLEYTSTNKNSECVAKRPSVLSPTESQKYQIVAQCLKKNFDLKCGWSGFKESLLSCKLEQSHLSLLLEAVPDTESKIGSKKSQDWLQSVEKVRELKKKKPETRLHDDEEFVYFISSIPNIYQRLQCMLVMVSFEELLKKIIKDIDILMRCICILMNNSKMVDLFDTILAVGNFLNEGTILGNRRWFKISTLHKIINFRGIGKESKGLLYLVASYMGSIFDNQSRSLLQKASQTPIVKVISNTAHSSNIFLLLSSECSESIMDKKGRRSTVSNTDDPNDKFAVEGYNFVKKNESAFHNLNTKFLEFLQSYIKCVMYFGDYEAFIPVDKKIDDEMNPGQQKNVEDIFCFLEKFFVAYDAALREVEKSESKISKDSFANTFLMSNSKHLSQNGIYTSVYEDCNNDIKGFREGHQFNKQKQRSTSTMRLNLVNLAPEIPGQVFTVKTDISLSENPQVSRNLKKNTSEATQEITNDNKAKIKLNSPRSGLKQFKPLKSDTFHDIVSSEASESISHMLYNSSINISNGGHSSVPITSYERRRRRESLNVVTDLIISHAELQKYNNRESAIFTKE